MSAVIVVVVIIDSWFPVKSKEEKSKEQWRVIFIFSIVAIDFGLPLDPNIAIEYWNPITINTFFFVYSFVWIMSTVLKLRKMSFYLSFSIGSVKGLYYFVFWYLFSNRKKSMWIQWKLWYTHINSFYGFFWWLDIFDYYLFVGVVGVVVWKTKSISVFKRKHKQIRCLTNDQIRLIEGVHFEQFDTIIYWIWLSFSFIFFVHIHHILYLLICMSMRVSRLSEQRGGGRIFLP